MNYIVIVIATGVYVIELCRITLNYPISLCVKYLNEAVKCSL